MAPKNIKDWLKDATNLNNQNNGDPTPIISFQYPDGRNVVKQYQEAFGGTIDGNLEFPESFDHDGVYPSSRQYFANLTLKIDDTQLIQVVDCEHPGLGARNMCVKLDIGDVESAYEVFKNVARDKGENAPAVEYREVEGGKKIAARFVSRCGVTWILVSPISKN
ncbi:hypothetical protein FRX31_017002 [Thalictrum thalictroides]|uniref:Uncharacterized protein n=1 Tax=Thalictrum thalictroides TaxID=46969 RepID=A0A7J6W856_THATH|nr:hypothetical protein FRX31_017002 [Thalictrum thalictroides]